MEFGGENMSSALEPLLCSKPWLGCWWWASQGAVKEHKEGAGNYPIPSSLAMSCFSGNGASAAVLVPKRPPVCQPCGPRPAPGAGEKDAVIRRWLQGLVMSRESCVHQNLILPTKIQRLPLIIGPVGRSRSRRAPCPCRVGIL